MPLAGPFIFDPTAELPAVEPEAWHLTWDGCTRHRPTRCEFRTWVTADGDITTALELCDPRVLPPPAKLAELARASVIAGCLLRELAAEVTDCDAQNRAERVSPWG